MRIDKIKTNKLGGVDVEATDVNETTRKQFRASIKDEAEAPKPSYFLAMINLSKLLLSWSGYKEDWIPSLIKDARVSGMSFKYNKDDSFDVVLNGRLLLPTGKVLELNTPAYNMSEIQMEDLPLIDEAIAQAIDYFGGERAQVDMDLGGAL